MPAKSPTDLTTELGILAERTDNTRREVETLGKAVLACKEEVWVVRAELTKETHKQQAELQATAGPPPRTCPRPPAARRPFEPDGSLGRPVLGTRRRSHRCRVVPRLRTHRHPGQEVAGTHP